MFNDKLRMNDYIEMKDGVKITQENIDRLMIDAIKSKNLKGCNGYYAGAEHKRKMNSLKDMPTIKQYEFFNNLYEVLKENGVNEFDSFNNIIKSDVQDMHRHQMKSIIWRMTQKCKELNIDYKADFKGVCKNCTYYRQQIGKRGYCKEMRVTRRETQGCSNFVERGNI